MCGRFTLRVTPEELADFFELHNVPELFPRPNICPTQPVTSILFDVESGDRESAEFRWGLIPSWSKEPQSGSPLINARSETVATKPAFRAAFKRRRCLIPADGFYEWQKVAGQKKKQPYYISLRNQPLLAFAGLWESWQPGTSDEINSCTIITTQANSAVARLHDRMPVVMPRESFEEWLDPTRKVDELTALLRPCPAEAMVLSAETADELLSGPQTDHQPRLF